MNTVLNAAWIAVQIIVGWNLVFPILLLLFRGLRKMVGAGSEWRYGAESDAPKADYAIIVTAYEQTDLIPAVIDSILKLRYSNYLVYIVADNCDVSNLHFDDPRIIVLRPENVIASNTGSHFYAIARFQRPHERLTIVDSDNLIHPEYLNALNPHFDAGYIAVQGVRAAKNLNTTLASLDAARDIYYHFYDGKLLFESGSSATLAGSGMAFTVKLYRSCLEHLEIHGAGFDKVLQYEIVRRAGRIAFAEDAIVYDEKTSGSEQLVKQRARWISSWFRYFSLGFNLVRKGIATGNWNQTLFGTVLLRPPLFIFLLLSVGFTAVNFFVAPIGAWVWAGAFACFVGAFLIALAVSPTDRRIYRALGGIPKFMALQMLSLVRVRRASKVSVATKHYAPLTLVETPDAPQTKTSKRIHENATQTTA